MGPDGPPVLFFDEPMYQSTPARGGGGGDLHPASAAADAADIYSPSSPTPTPTPLQGILTFKSSRGRVGQLCTWMDIMDDIR